MNKKTMKNKLNFEEDILEDEDFSEEDLDEEETTNYLDSYLEEEDDEEDTSFVFWKHHWSIFKYVEDKPVLTPKEEKRLLKIYFKNKPENGKNRIVPVEKLTPEQREAREMLINSNLKLVIKLASKKYKDNIDITLQELIHEGTIGLIEAIDNFEIDKGNKLSTYAHFLILQKVSRYLVKGWNNVRIPEGVHRQGHEIKNFINRTREEEGREVSEDELCELFDLKPKRLKQIMDCMQIQNTTSLDKFLTPSEDDERSLRHIVWEEDKGYYTDDGEFIGKDAIDKNILRKQLTSVMKLIPPSSQKLLEKVYIQEEIFDEGLALKFWVTKKKLKAMIEEAKIHLKVAIEENMPSMSDFIE